MRLFRRPVVPTVCLCAVVMATVTLSSRHRQRRVQAEAALATAVEMQDWSLADLRDALEERGLNLTLTSEYPGHAVRNVGYLLSPGRGHPGRPLLASRAEAGKWRGLACCWRTNDASRDALLSQEPDYSFRAGPFLFFGDPALLERIRCVLGVPATPGK